MKQIVSFGRFFQPLYTHWFMGLALLCVAASLWRITIGFDWSALSVILLSSGLLCNALVTACNQDAMPVAVSPDQMKDADAATHQPMNPQTRLRWLGDYIPLGDRLFSPGDLLLFSGVLIRVGLLVIT